MLSVVSDSSSQPPPPTAPTIDAEQHEEVKEEAEKGGRGTWKHAAFHVATTIATPAAYAPLPFALASLGWPLGQFSCFLCFLFFFFFWLLLFGCSENLLGKEKGTLNS
jgi:hypothetical protein